MCKENSTGIHPDDLREEPKDWSAEKTAICHPGEKGRPCEIGEREKED